MTRFLLLLPFLALGACANADGDGPRLGRLMGKPEPVVPEPLPPQVLSALPVGVPPSVVTRNADGCYLITLEMTDPPTGFPLTDADGDRVCEVDAIQVEGVAAEPSPVEAIDPA